MAYFSNGTEGMRLADVCSECLMPDDAPCPVLYIQEIYNYDQCDSPKLKEVMEWLIPSDTLDCKLCEVLKRYMRPKDDPKQMNLFQDQITPRHSAESEE